MVTGGPEPESRRESLEDLLARLRPPAPPTPPATSELSRPAPADAPGPSQPLTPSDEFAEARRSMSALLSELTALRRTLRAEISASRSEPAPGPSPTRDDLDLPHPAPPVAPEPQPVSSPSAAWPSPDPAYTPPSWAADPPAGDPYPTFPIATDRPLAAPAPIRRPSGPRVSRRALVAVAGLVALSLVGGGAWKARQVMQDSQTRVAALRQAVAPSAEGPGVAAAGPEAVRQVCAEAQALSRELGPMAELAGVAAPAAQVVGRVPQVGDQAAGKLALASASAETLAALREACDVLDPLVNVPGSGTDVSALVSALGDGRDRLRGAAGRLRAAQGQLAAVDPRGLEGSERGIYQVLRDRLPAVAARLELMGELPGLLGYDGPRTFLVLGQNGDEIRPTGGFIGTAGLLTFDRGKLVDRQYGSSFFWDLPTDRRVTPPEPLQRHMAASYWQLKESNWMPDFPAAAQQARYFHELMRPEPVAGVVAVDQHVVELLLELTGPVEVPDYGEVVSAANVRDRLEYHTHLVPNWGERERKGFVSALFGVLMDRLNGLPSDRMRDLAGVLERALAAQSIQVWSPDDRAQQAFADLGWDGRMLSAEGDYLYAVGANVGQNKINREVEQEVSYEVSEDGSGRLIGRAIVTLRNRRPTTDPGPYPTADLLDYLRVYAPGGSELISASGFDDNVTTAGECGRTAFGGRVRVRPASERQLQLVYRLPARLRRDDYRLLVQKQPGVDAHPLTVRAFGGSVVSTPKATGPSAFAWEGGTLGMSPWSSVSQGAPTRPACAVRADTPQVLQPPRELVIPKIGVRADFTELGVQPDGVLESPKTGAVVGWYRDTARPGQAGNMIMSGHVDWEKQPAIFWRLRELQQGDVVQVMAQDGLRYRYAVDWTKSFDPAGAPLREILGPTSQRWLTLITCGGTFNQVTRQYSERLVVRARLVGTE